MISKTELNSLREKILPILLPAGFMRISLFGSVARGENTAKSDVDILVKSNPYGEGPFF